MNIVEGVLLNYNRSPILNQLQYSKGITIQEYYKSLKLYIDGRCDRISQIDNSSITVSPWAILMYYRCTHSVIPMK